MVIVAWPMDTSQCLVAGKTVLTKPRVLRSEKLVTVSTGRPHITVKGLGLRATILGGSWVVISGVISPLM